jgi:hypothetical protein
MRRSLVEIAWDAKGSPSATSRGLPDWRLFPRFVVEAVAAGRAPAGITCKC